MQRFLASVSGTILDREGKPMAGAEVVYTNVGMVDHAAATAGIQRITEGTGKVYKVKQTRRDHFHWSAWNMAFTRLRLPLRTEAMFIQVRRA
jgi:hypothetical protein